MERLFTLTSLPRAATANIREYLTNIRRRKLGNLGLITQPYKACDARHRMLRLIVGQRDPDHMVVLVDRREIAQLLV